MDVLWDCLARDCAGTFVWGVANDSGDCRRLSASVTWIRRARAGESCTCIGWDGSCVVHAWAVLVCGGSCAAVMVPHAAVRVATVAASAGVGVDRVVATVVDCARILRRWRVVSW